MFGALPKNSRLRAAMQLCMSLLVCLPAAAATNLVTGNGFGFAVVREHSATLTSFYAHPYSFTRPDPQNPLSEGIPTANFLKSLAWSGTTVTRIETNYLRDSQIIRASSNGGEGYFFMPWGLNRAALIVAWKPGPNPAKPALSVEWSHPIATQKQVRISGQSAQVFRFEGIEESLLVIPIGGQNAAAHFPDSSSSWALISLETDSDLEPALREFAHWRGDLDSSSLVERELTDLDRWRVTPPVKFTSSEEQHLWRQSEVMLRMAQSREPNRPGRYSHGLIVASLPDGVWFTPWVRDMAYATVAFARMGHQAEARDALLAYFNARPTGKMRPETRGTDYQISVVRYFGDGSEEPFFTMEGRTNIEFDDWGEVLWALGQYMRKYDDTALLSTVTYRGRLYESARGYIVKPLLANLEPYKDGLIVAADTSIWEEHQKDAKHFAFSTAAAIAGLREFEEIARRTGDEPTHALLSDRLALVERGFNAAFIRDGKLHGTLEPGIKNDIDGALLAIIRLGVVTDPALIHDTVERMELLKVASGGYRRVRSTYTDPAIFEYWYERQEFVFVDLSFAEVLRHMGQSAAADAMLQRIVGKAAADHNIIPEMYVAVPCQLFPGKIGDPTSARPMVGYGAGAYILHLLDREAVKP